MEGEYRKGVKDSVKRSTADVVCRLLLEASACGLVLFFRWLRVSGGAGAL